MSLFYLQKVEKSDKKTVEKWLRISLGKTGSRFPRRIQCILCPRLPAALYADD